MLRSYHLLLIVFGAMILLGQTTRTWTNALANDRWDQAGNWSPGAVPGTSDSVVFNSISNVNRSGSSPTPRSITITGLGSITLTSPNADLAASAYITVNGTLNLGSNSVTADSSITGSGTITMNDGSLTAGTDLTVSIITVQGNNEAVIDVGRNWSVSTFTQGHANVTFNGAYHTEIASSTSFYYLTVNKTANSYYITSSSAITVTIDSLLELTTGTFLTNSASAINVQGSGSGTDYLSLTTASAILDIGGTSVFPTGFEVVSLSSSSTVSYSGGNQSILDTLTYGNLSLSGSGTKSTSAALTIDGNFTSASTTFTAGPYNHTVGGSWTMSSGTFTATSGTVLTFSGSSMTLTHTAGNLDTVKFSGAGIANLGSAINVAGLHLPASRTLTTNNYNVTIRGDFIKNASATYTPGSNTTFFAGSGNQIVASATYYTLSVTGTGTKTAAGGLTVNRALAVSAGTLDLGSYSHGMLLYAGTNTNGIQVTGTGGILSTGTVTFQQTNTCDISLAGGITDTTYVKFENIVVSGTGTLDVEANSHLLARGTITINSGTLLNMQTTADMFADHLVVNGTLYLSGSRNFPSITSVEYNQVSVETDGRVYYYTNTSMSIPSIVNNCYDLVLYSGNSTNTIFTLSADIIIRDDLILGRNNGTERTVLRSNGFDITVYESVTVEYNDSLISTGDFNVLMNANENNTFYDGIGAYFSFNNLSFDVQSGATTNRETQLIIDGAGSQFIVSGNFSVLNSNYAGFINELELQGTALISTTGSNTLNMGAYAWISSNGTSNFEDFIDQFETLSLTANSGISYVNGTQTIAATYNSGTSRINYRNLHLDGGTKTVEDTLVVLGAFFADDDAYLVDNGLTHFIAGDFGINYNGDINQVLTGTFVFNGSNQTIAYSRFNNVIFAGTGTKTNGTFSLLVPANGGSQTEARPIGQWIINGNLTVNNSVIVDGANQAVTSYGYFANSAGTFTHTSTVTFSGTTDQVISGQFYNVTFNNTTDTVWAGSDLTISGNVTFNLNSIFADSGKTINVAGNWIRNNASIYAATGTLKLTGSDQYIDQNYAAGRVFNHIHFSGSGTKQIYDAGFTLNGNWTGDPGVTVDMNNYSYTITGNFANDATLDQPGTITFDGITQSISNSTLGSIVISGGGSKKTLTGNLLLTGSITINATDTLDLSASNFTLELQGAYTNNGYLYAQQGTVKFSGTAAQTLSTGGIGAGARFYNLTVDKSSQNVNVSTYSVDVDNNFTITNGTMAFSTNDLYVGGNFDNNGTITQSAARSITFDATSGTKTIYGGAYTFTGYTIFNPNSSVSYLIGEDVTFSDAVRINNGTVNLNNKTVTINDSLYVNGGTLTVNQDANLLLDVHLYVASSAFLNVVGNEDSLASISRVSTNRYTTDIRGTVQARHYSIAYMAATGFRLSSSAVINASNNFSDGSFSQGASGGLYLEYLGEPASSVTDTIKNVSFGSGPATNVSRTSGTYNLVFFNSKGNLAGVLYENDSPDGGAATGYLRWERSGATWVGGTSGSEHDWSIAANWTPNTGLPPQANENVTILETAYYPTIGNGVNATANNIFLDADSLVISGTGTLNISSDLNILSTGRLVMTGYSDTLTIGGAIQNAGTIDYGSSILKFNASSGSQNLDFGAGSISNLTFNSSSATWLLQSAIVVSGNFEIVSGTVDVTSSAYQINVAGNWTNNGSLTYRTGTVVFDGTNQGLYGSNNSFYRINFNTSGTKTLNSNLSAYDDVTFANMTVELDAQSNTVEVGGDWALTSGTIIQFIQTGSGTLNFNKTDDSTDDTQDIAATDTIMNLTFSGTQRKEVNGILNVKGNMLISIVPAAGTDIVDVNTFTINGVGASNTFTMNASTTIRIGQSNFPAGFEITSFDPASEVRYGGFTGTYTLETNGGTIIYGILTVQSATPHTRQPNGNLNFRTLTLASPTIIDLWGTSTAYDMTVYTAMNIATGAQILADSSSVTFNTTAPLTIDADLTNVKNLYIQGSGVKTLGGNLNVRKNLTIDAGSTLTIPAAYTANSGFSGVFTLGSGSSLNVGAAFPSGYSSYSAASNSTVTYNGTGAQTVNNGFSYGNLSFDNGSPTADIVSGALTILGNLIITGDGALDLGTDSIYLAGDFTNSNAAAGITANTSKFVLNGGDQLLTIAGNSTFAFNDLIMRGSGTKTNAGTDAFDINGDLVIFENITFATNNQNLAIYGDYSNLGSVTHTAGTVTFDGDNQNINPGLSSLFNVAFSTSGTKTIASNGLDVNGTTTINPGLSVDFSNLSHSFASTFTNNGNAFKSTGSFTFDASSGTQVVTLNANDTLNNLIFSNSATRTLAGPTNLVITGNLTSNGTFNTSNINLFVGANFTNNGTINIGTSNLTLNASSANAYTFTANTTSFNDVNISANSNAVYRLQSSSNDINGALRIKSGIFKLNGKTLTVGDAATDSIVLGSTGQLQVDSNSTLSLINGSSLVANSGSHLKIVGVSGQSATVKGITNAVDRYGIFANTGSTVSARYYSISYVDSITVANGATLNTVTNFSDGILSNGTTGGVYLKLANTLGSIDTIKNVNFGSGPTYNIARPAGTGGSNYVISEYLGSLGGSSYERDPNNLITWTSPAQNNWTGAVSKVWTNPLNWSSGLVPDSTVLAVIPVVGTVYPEIDGVTAKMKGLQIANLASLTTKNGAKVRMYSQGLELSGTLVLAGSDTLYNQGALTVNTGAVFAPSATSLIVMNGIASQSISTATGSFTNLSIASGANVTLATAIDIDGNLTIGSSATFDVSETNYQVTIGGGLVNNGTLNPRSGTIIFDGSSSSSLTSGNFYTVTFNHSGTLTSSGTNTVAYRLIQNSGTITAGGSFDVNGTLGSNSANKAWHINTGAIFNDGGYTHTNAGGLDIDGTYSGSGYVKFDGSVDGTYILNASTLRGVIISGSLTKYINGNINIRSLKVESGVFNTLATYNITAGGATDTLSVSNGASFTISTSINGFETVLNEAGSTVTFNTGNQNITAGTYGNITFNGTSATKTLQGNISVLNNLYVNNGVILDANSTFNYQISVAGNFTLTSGATFRPRLGTVVLNGSLTQAIAPTLADTAHSFYNLTINNSSVSDRIEINSTMRILNDLTILDGNLDFNNNTIYIGGDYENSDTHYFGGTSVVNFVPAPNSSVSLTFNSTAFDDITFNSSGSVFTMTDAFATNDNLTVTAGKLVLGAYTNRLGDGADSHTISDSLTLSAGSTMQINTNGSFTVASTAVLSMIGTSGQPISISNVSGTNRYSFTVNGKIRAEYYSFSYMSSAGIYLTSSSSIDATSNLSNGTFTNGASGGTLLRIENTQTDTINYLNFPSNPGGGAKNITKSVAVSGTLTFKNVSGDFSGSAYESDTYGLLIWPDLITLTWNGTSGTSWTNTANWTQSSGPAAYPDSSKIVIIPNTLNKPQITSGTGRTFDLTIQTGGQLTLNGANLITDGNLTITGTLTATNATDSITVKGNWSRTGTYTNGSAPVFLKPSANISLNNGGTFFRKLEITAGGTVTLASALNVTTDLSIISGTLDVSTTLYAVTVNGNWSNSGTFNGRTGTVTLSASSGTKTINNGSSTFNNLTINANSVIYQINTNDLTVNGNLNLSAGTLDLNGNNLIFGDASGDILTVDGVLDIAANEQLLLGPSTSVNVSSSGQINIVGSDEMNVATVSRSSSGTYTFSVDGTISARYYLFEYMNTSGIQLNASASVNSTNNFSDGTFSNGASGGRYLLMANTWPAIPADTIRNITFNAGPSINVRRVSGSGPSIVFNDPQGPLAGVTYEDDTPDGGTATGYIHWRYTSTIYTWQGDDGIEPTRWDVAENWDIGAVPDSNVNVIIPNVSNDPIINSTSGSARVKNLTINAGGLLTLQNGEDLMVKGTMSNAGTFTVTNGSASVIDVYNLWSNTGTFNHGSASTVRLKAASGTKLITDGTSAFYNLTIDSSATFTLSSNLDVDNNLTISEGTLDVTASNYQINVGGDWSNSSSFTSRSGTVVFDKSSGNQNITTGGTNSSKYFYRVTFNSAATKTLVTDTLFVTNMATFTNGIVLTDNSAILYLGVNATVAGYNSSSFVRGPMMRTWSTSTGQKLFPIGKSTAYRPITIYLTSPVNTVIKAEMINSNSSGTADVTLGAISDVRYYNYSIVSGSANTGTITIEYGGDDGVGTTLSNTGDNKIVIAQSSTSSGTYQSLGQASIAGSAVTSVSFTSSEGDYLLIGSSAPTVTASLATLGTEGTELSSGRFHVGTVQLDRYNVNSSSSRLTQLVVQNRSSFGTVDAADIDSVLVYMDKGAQTNVFVGISDMTGASGGSSTIVFNQIILVDATPAYLKFIYKRSTGATLTNKIGLRVAGSSSFTFKTGASFPSTSFPLQTSQDITLPVELVKGSFKAKKVKDGFIIMAKTATEDNVANILIQRSTSIKNLDELTDEDWETIHVIPSSYEYSTQGRQLPETHDKIDLRNIKKLRYRLVAEENGGILRKGGDAALLDIDESLLQVNEFVLNQNYPNPFNPTTTITFAVPYQSKITINIYNMLGQLVSQLVKDKVYEAGAQYQEIWNGSNMQGIKVASGIYIYQLINNESKTVISKKMVMLK